MDYQATPQSGKSYIHMWDVASTVVFVGGFLVDKSSLPLGLEVLPKGTFLKVDLTERKASVVKTAILYEAITALSTAVKIKKGSLLIATDVVGTGADPLFDSFPIVANALGVIALGGVVQSYTAAGVAINPDGLNFCNVDIDAQPSCSVIYEARGVVPEALPSAITDAIIGALKFVQFLKK